MLTMKTTLTNGSEIIEEIEHAHINHTTSCVWYKPFYGKSILRLRPEETSQVFIMNDAGKTVMSYNFVGQTEKVKPKNAKRTDTD